MSTSRTTLALLVALLVMFLLPGLILGQQGAQEPGKRLQEFQKRLNLTPEQTEQIRPILEDEAKKVNDIQAKYQDDTSRRSRMNMMRDLRAVRQDAQKRIEPFLTSDQKAEWDKIRAERREASRERRRQ